MELMYEFLEKAASGKRFSAAEKEAAKPLFDEMYELLESRKNPPNFKLASGDIAKGATGRIALNAYFLLLGRKLLGADYTRKDKRFSYWNMYLAYHIMRSNFGGWSEKGIYCCSTCTISMLPLYCINAFPDLNCEEMKNNVIDIINNEKGSFSRKYNRNYTHWAMRFI